MDAALKQRVLRKIKDAEVVDLCSRILRIPSFKTEEQKVAKYLATFFPAAGI